MHTHNEHREITMNKANASPTVIPICAAISHSSAIQPTENWVCASKTRHCWNYEANVYELSEDQAWLLLRNEFPGSYMQRRRKKGTASARMNLMPYAEKVQRRSGTATTITTILVTQNRLNAQQRIWGEEPIPDSQLVKPQSTSSNPSINSTSV